MNREVSRSQVKEITINVAGSKIESVRRKNISKTGLRLYDGGYIGTAGVIGMNEGYNNLLFEKAKEALKQKIPYKQELSGNKTLSMDLHKSIFEESHFTPEIEELLLDMHRSNPNYIFSNKIKYEQYETSLANDKNLSLIQKDDFFSMELTYKEKSSANIYDGFIELSARNYDRKEILRQAGMICSAQDNILELPEGRVPVIFSTLDYTLFKKFMLDLNGRAFGAEGSLLSGKLGKRVFNPNFTLLQTNAPEDGRYTFFDAEGTTNKDYRYPLISEGIVAAPYTDKKTAAQYGLPHTGSAISEYDGVPMLGTPGFKIVESAKTAKELLNGKEGIFVKLAMGGDFKPNGDFATPVQLALVYDGEHFVGRLPQLQIASNVFEMFGDAYIGTGSSKVSSMSDEKCVIMELAVEKL